MEGEFTYNAGIIGSCLCIEIEQSCPVNRTLFEILNTPFVAGVQLQMFGAIQVALLTQGGSH